MKIEEIKQKFLGKTCDTGIAAFLVCYIMPEEGSLFRSNAHLLHFFGCRNDVKDMVLSDNLYVSEDGINWKFNGGSEDTIIVLSQNEKFCRRFISRLFGNEDSDNLIIRVLGKS